MEIKAYFQILLKRWWAILLGLIVVTIATYIWTNLQQTIYETTATYIIRPREGVITDDKFVAALDMVSRRVEINTTFAEVAGSKLIKDMAVATLELAADQRKQLSVSGSVVGGTNILSITAQSTDPVVARDFANAVGVETVKYVSGLYDVFELQPLDAARIPSRPISPNLPLNMMMGAFFGLALGIGLAFLVEYIKTPFVEADTFNIIDRDTGAYNKSYLTLRLGQEMNRAKRNKYPLSLGLIRVEFQGEAFSNRDRVAAMRMFKILTERSIREEDILACFNGDTFAILFPHMPALKARDFVEIMKQKINAAAPDLPAMDANSHLRSYASVVTYTGGFIKQESLLDKAIHALETAGSKPGELVTVT